MTATRNNGITAANAVTNLGQSDIAHLNNIISTVMNTRNGMFDLAASTGGHHSPLRTPPRRTATLPGQEDSPTHPTPTKLPRFLAFAEKNLGVKDATALEWRLQEQGYGPDVLDAVPDEKLTELDISHGDIIRLKRGAPTWWNGPLAKRARVEAGVDGDACALQNADRAPAASANAREEVDPNMRVRFERRWKDGASRMYGPRIRASDDFPEEKDYEDWFFCEEADVWMKVPDGYVAEIANMDDADDF